MDAVVELVLEGRLSLLVNGQTARERVQVQDCVSAGSGRRGVLPDAQDDPDPVPVVVCDCVGLPAD